MDRRGATGETTGEMRPGAVDGRLGASRRAVDGRLEDRESKDGNEPSSSAGCRAPSR